MKRSFFAAITIIIALFFIACGCKKEDDTSGDLVTTNIFEGSFNEVQSYPDPQIITFRRETGENVTLLVIPGQVVILANGNSSSEIKQLAEANEGTIAAQIPLVRLYLVTIAAEKINDFLDGMYQSDLVFDAFPNGATAVRGNSQYFGYKSTSGDKNSIVQTIDLSTDMGCNKLHKDAVGIIAGQSGVSVNVNDVTRYNAGKNNATTDTYKKMEKMLELLNYSHQNSKPIVINMAIGGWNNVREEDYCFRLRFIYMLQAVEWMNPQILDNAVIIMSCTNAGYNEKGMLDSLRHDFPNSPLWNHLYFAGSSEGQGGCGMGYAPAITENYLSAPACNIAVPGTNCVVDGNSFSAPVISGTIAKTYELLQTAGIPVQMPEIAAVFKNYQKQHPDIVPTPTELFNIIAGVAPDEVKYDGTWSGTFFYTATLPQEFGSPQVVNSSFVLEMTLESNVSVPGYSQLLKVKLVKCSDPAFGATSFITPDQTLSMAILPKAYGSSSDLGMGIVVKFPNGSDITTNNSPAGALTVSADGKTLANSNLVLNSAFFASGTVGNSNLPGSGPGGYAYNWCIFKSWSLVKK